MSHADQLRLLKQLQGCIEGGQPADASDIEPLTKSPHVDVRGPAKWLLAFVIQNDSIEHATELAVQACEDLGYSPAPVLRQAISFVAGVGQFEQAFELRIRAAQHALSQGDYALALVHISSAGTLDFRFNGAKLINEPQYIRHMVDLYETLSLKSAPGILRHPRHTRRSSSQRLKIAHVVCQILDDPHAPTRVTESIIKYTDRTRFDPTLFVTDSLCPTRDRAFQDITSSPSHQRGAKRLAQFQRDYDIDIVLPESLQTHVHAATDLAQKMAERNIDVAFYHGSISTPTEWLLCAWHAAPWQFDCGFGVPLHCPHVDHQFFLFERTMEQLAFLCREHDIPYGHGTYGSADCEGIEHATPVSRDALGIPNDHVILGTTGNHLVERMSPAFCQTIARVMHEQPKTSYVVVGRGEFKSQRQMFGTLCDKRIRFVGHTDCPEVYTKAFDIYVNEYPAGGGMSIAEAMAAEKPVTCMQADDSSLALAGAYYVGQNNLITPATDEAYAARLTTLICDNNERQRMGRMLKQRYVKTLSPAKHMKDLCDHIWHTVMSAH